MEQLLSWFNHLEENIPYVTPVLFILFHIIRPILFIPVTVICITGGLLFGLTHGVLYSWVGITLSSVMFYAMMHHSQKDQHYLNRLRELMQYKLQALSTSQIVLLRLTPFVHFHLISLIMIELTRNFKEYVKLSVFTNMPLALIYTTLGQWLHSLQWTYLIGFILFLGLMFFLLRRRELIWSWDEYFAFKN
ncbi:TVP38/TMEM64 family protein [Alkalibacillus sp. S2W]|uniref:TVP38/TMEM64 family protein n=1 Tax=Alkalibacillus TaxID=331654 RepID=UPI00141EFDA4|nr:VTT domain-containing protein [Alkalibacillus almallahensis]NIK11105.1 putative membrane protein YdjX (TVP38/TMEM64 family) [Alkalibacillus almallahensis]